MRITIDTRLANNKEIKDLQFWAIKNKRRRQILYNALFILLTSKNSVPQTLFIKKMNKSKDRLYKFIREVPRLIKTVEVVQEARGYKQLGKGVSKQTLLGRYRGRYSVKDKDKAGFIFMWLFSLKTIEELYDYKRSLIRERNKQKKKG